ncbi:MAG: transglycosylase domain-containing protein [Ruminococcus sp.]|nr:transglycosylase domain-containing protein [Ruminococcus sp.]
MAKSNHEIEDSGTPASRTGKKKKKKNIFLLILKKLMAVTATTLLSLFLIIVITGTIVATALTIYVMDFMDDSSTISLATLESGSDTYFYGTEINEDGEEEMVVLKQMKTDIQRIPVSIERIPQHVRDAFVYTEDERFYVHDGVDYKRTLSAFLNMFLHFYDTNQGGSTITQQLIKNLTGDSEQTPQRKIREIFSAMQLEKDYSKDEILEEYLNFIGFGGPINGIQLASIRYFGKNVEDLTVPEAAVLAAIPKSPNDYGPFVETEDMDGNVIINGKANNKTRQGYVLWQMYKNAAITYDEYQQYLSAPILYTDSEEYRALHPEIDLQEVENEQNAYTWEVDAMVYEAAKYLMELYNIDEQEAITRINKGGYRIYSTLDKRMQNYVEEKFLDLNNFIAADSVRKWVDLDNDGEAEEQLPHVAFVALRYDGSVMAEVGNVGEKKGSLVTNYANREPRQVGSTMKPVATYGLGIESDHIHWGSVYRNLPLSTIKDEKGNLWPFNYGRVAGDGSAHNIYYFLQQSFNTVPAQLVDELTPNAVFKFCTEKLGMQLDSEDEDYSPLALGSLTYGITLQNLVNAYLPYGTHGIYNEAHIISKIEDANNQIIVDNTNGRNPRQAVSDETAWVMNRLIKNVVDNGTGTAARLGNKVVVGKTGTTENWYDLAFVGLTRDFASGITIGYKEYNESLMLPEYIKSAQVWYNIIGEYANNNFLDTDADFAPSDTVIAVPMCTATGMIAGAYCPKGITGYWKSTNAPVCDGSHYIVVDTPASASNTWTDNNTNDYSWNQNNNYNNIWTDPNAGGGNTWTDPNAGNTWTDPNAGNTWTDPNAGAGNTGDTGGWTDPNAGGNTGGDTGGWVDPNAGGNTGGDTGAGGAGDVQTW